jgi:hypothetical protein
VCGINDLDHTCDEYFVLVPKLGITLLQKPPHLRPPGYTRTELPSNNLAGPSSISRDNSHCPEHQLSALKVHYNGVTEHPQGGVH